MIANSNVGQKVREYYLFLEEIYQSWLIEEAQRKEASRQAVIANQEIENARESLATSNHVQYSKIMIDAAQFVVPMLERLGLDDRGKLIVQNFGYNCLLTLSNKSATSELQDRETSSHPLSMTDMLKSMGVKCEKADVQKLGKMVAKAYRELHSDEPPKQTQLNEFGRSIKVNFYLEKDRNLILQQIENYKIDFPDRIRVGRNNALELV